MTKNCAVIVAAGKGTRMGLKTNKQFINIKDKPVLYYTLKVFSDCPEIDEIVIVMSSENIEYCKNEIIEKYDIKKVKAIVAGGEERQQSVYYGLQAVQKCNIVLIHDGARPFINNKIIEDGIKYAEIYGASACGVKPKDTIKVIDKNNFSVHTPDRASMFAVQTPQCFKYDIIISCHDKIKSENVSVTDDTMILERYGYKVYLYEGSYKNIKITTPEDLILAEAF